MAFRFLHFQTTDPPNSTVVTTELVVASWAVHPAVLPGPGAATAYLTVQVKDLVGDGTNTADFQVLLDTSPGGVTGTQLLTFSRTSNGAFTASAVLSTQLINSIRFLKVSAKKTGTGANPILVAASLLVSVEEGPYLATDPASDCPTSDAPGDSSETAFGICLEADWGFAETCELFWLDSIQVIDARTVRVRFTRPVGITAADTDLYTLTGPSTVVVESASQVSSDDEVIDLHLTSDLPRGTWTVVVSGLLESAAGTLIGDPP